MSEEELKQTIETNFRLVLMDNRQLSAGLRSVAEQTARLASQVSTLADNVDANSERLEQTVDAIKTLAFGSAEVRAENQRLWAAVNELRSRVERLEAS